MVILRPFLLDLPAPIINIRILLLLILLLRRRLLLHIKLRGRLPSRCQKLDNLHLLGRGHFPHSGTGGCGVIVAVVMHLGTAILLHAMHIPTATLLVPMMLLLITAPMVMVLLLMALLAIVLLLAAAALVVGGRLLLLFHVLH